MALFLEREDFTGTRGRARFSRFSESRHARVAPRRAAQAAGLSLE